MILIALTNAEGEEFKHYFNVQNIHTLNKSKAGSKIYAGGDESYVVKETIDEIFQMIAEALQEEKLIVHHGLDSNQKGITTISKE